MSFKAWSSLNLVVDALNVRRCWRGAAAVPPMLAMNDRNTHCRQLLHAAVVALLVVNAIVLCWK